MKNHLLTALIALCVLSPLAGLRAQPPAPAPGGAPGASEAPADPAGIQGLWVWRDQWVRDAQGRRTLLDFSEQYGFNRLLVQVHLEKRTDEPTLRYPDGLRALVIEAAARGIAVEALDGAKDMAMRKNWPRTLAILDLVLAFNRSLPADARLAGIHYDIEPYIMDAWDEGDRARQTIMLDLLGYYAKARARIDREEGDFTLAADIPFWYDNKTEPDDSCVVTYNGETKNLHRHIQDICDYIGIMSYRTTATGRNSVAGVVQAELDYAAKIGKVVTPALETIELPEVPHITFYGQTPAEFWRVHNRVRAELGDHPGFGGMLTHCFYGLRAVVQSGE